MKNIADVNSDDILSELNSLNYEDDDLKLLDDEDIKPISSTKEEDDLADFYMDYNEPKVEDNKPKIDLYTEKDDDAPVVELITPHHEELKTDNTSSKEDALSQVSSVDAYLNRNIKARPISPNRVERNVNPQVQPVTPPKAKEEPPAPVRTTIQDLNQLFDKVSNNVKGASEIVNRNTEIKRKIDERYEELRRMQQEHEANKKKDYAEINTYKEDVYAKLQAKKSEIEKELVTLRADQEALAKDRAEFESYKNTSLANLKKLEDELRESYDSRNKNIEQVELGLVKRKEQLDAERTNLANERKELDKERTELSQNLVQFNKLVDEFTKGIDNFN